MKLRKWILLAGIVLVVVSLARSAASDSPLQDAIGKYDRAVASKDVATVRTLLAPDVLLYEHSVRNAGIEDVFENHLKPEIVEFENMKMDFSDVRLTTGGDLALLTRQYRLQGRVNGRDIDAKGNETMVWKKIGPDWKIIHIHYSHGCPRPPAPKQ